MACEHEEQTCCGKHEVIDIEAEAPCPPKCDVQVLFDNTSQSAISPVIHVRDYPVHIMVAPGMPEDHIILVERGWQQNEGIESGCADTDECPDMPWSPYPCDPLCCDSTGEQVSLFNIANPSNASIRNIKNDVWLTEAGDYRLTYSQGYNLPLTITVYAVVDCMDGGHMKGNCCPPSLEPCPPSEPVVTIGETPTVEEFVYCVDGVRKQRPLQIPPPPEFECCDTVYPIAAQQGGGICVEIGPTSTGQVVWQSRDGTFLEGAGTVGGNPPGPLTISDTSPYDEPSLLVVVMRGVSRSFDIPGPYAYLDDESVTFRLDEALAIPRPDYYDNPLQTSISQIEEGPAVYVDGFTRYERGNTPGTMHYQRVLSANEAFTLYGQWWLTLHVNTAGGVFLYHGEMDVEGYILRGVTP